jgi:hypothetical protein
MRRFLLAAMLTLPVFVFSQGPAPQPERAVPEPENAQPLPVRRVLLYKTGVGYFELQRYTRQLDQQETRLERLEGELARAAAEMERAQRELGALIGSISFDLTTP